MRRNIELEKEKQLKRIKKQDKQQTTKQQFKSSHPANTSGCDRFVSTVRTVFSLPGCLYGIQLLHV